MAAAMRKKGYEVGIMDADITGPSIPKMYGIHGKAVGDGKEILPAVAEDGTRIMSVNLLVDIEETPVVWRGPVVAGVVKQFWVVHGIKLSCIGSFCICRVQWKFSKNGQIKVCCDFINMAFSK